MQHTIVTIITSLLIFLSVPAIAQTTTYKFQFGVDKAKQGYTRLGPTSAFSDEAGYGFDFGSSVRIVETAKKKKSKRSFVTADKPFFFSVKVPEGNYKVTLTIGDNKARGELTVKAESRRLMLEKVVTFPGQCIRKSFVVNVRRPEISTGGKVSLKERELEKLDWDNKLTLEFNGARPCVSAIEIKRVDDQVTVYLAGNSTVVNQGAEPWASWGQMIPRFFKPGVAISNHAESGLTLASFKGQQRLNKIMSTIKPGDYLFIEFGHNDQKMSGPNDGAWKSYSENLKYYLEEAKKKQARVVIITPTSRRRFDEHGKTINTLGDFPAAARKVAEENDIALIDLNRMTEELYNALGVEQSKKALVHYPAYTFPGQDKALADNTHFNAYGAYEIARCVIEGIRKNKLDLVKFIVNVPSFDPNKPDAVDEFNLAQTPGSEIAKPDGN